MTVNIKYWIFKPHLPTVSDIFFPPQKYCVCRLICRDVRGSM